MRIIQALLLLKRETVETLYFEKNSLLHSLRINLPLQWMEIEYITFYELL